MQQGTRHAVLSSRAPRTGLASWFLRSPSVLTEEGANVPFQSLSCTARRESKCASQCSPLQFINHRRGLLREKKSQNIQKTEKEFNVKSNKRH